MSESDNKKLGMDCDITRRDFLNGVAVGATGILGESLLPPSLTAWNRASAAQDRPGYYPPALTGMRGSHAGSFEAAHAVRDGQVPAKGAKAADTKETYDLVIVGAGISGLAAAHFWRTRNPNARILILDNHDDFGGHAKRNEFRATAACCWATAAPGPSNRLSRTAKLRVG
jgi:spermidine dehydrogenase